VDGDGCLGSLLVGISWITSRRWNRDQSLEWLIDVICSNCKTALTVKSLPL
jgi:hypothetical protein